MKTVLVIEDNRDNLKLIRYSLTHSGYEVLSAETGEEGIKLALSSRPFFIITDINLPGIDGLETIRQLRSSEIGDSVPIIAITSYAMRGDREKILAAGSNGYFEKPIDPVTIVDSIHKVLGIDPDRQL